MVTVQYMSTGEKFFFNEALPHYNFKHKIWEQINNILCFLDWWQNMKLYYLYINYNITFSVFSHHTPYLNIISSHGFTEYFWESILNLVQKSVLNEGRMKMLQQSFIYSENY